MTLGSLQDSAKKASDPYLLSLFPIPKPGSGRTLGAMQNNKVVQKCHCDLSCLFRRNSVVLCVTLLSLVCGIKDMECKALVPRELHMHDLSN